MHSMKSPTSERYFRLRPDPRLAKSALYFPVPGLRSVHPAGNHGKTLNDRSVLPKWDTLGRRGVCRQADLPVRWDKLLKSLEPSFSHVKLYMIFTQ